MGKPKTAEHRAKISAALRGKPKTYDVWNKGLDKNNDLRVAAYSEKLKGRVITIETRTKISSSKFKGIPIQLFCQKCGKRKGKSKRPLCVNCAAKWRSQNYPNASLGKPMHENTRTALQAATSKQTRPTKPELFVGNCIDFMFGSCSPYRYSGSGHKRFWIKVPGRTRNPDFVSPFHKKVIEVFGRYWHQSEDEKEIIAQYRASGWECLVIWDDDFDGLRDRIMEFTYLYEFMYEMQEPF